MLVTGGLENLKENEEYIIVDLNSRDQMNEAVSVDRIVEIIDHHGISKYLHTYTGLKRLQIDRLGAAATIVAERFKESGLKPSRESAILLYYGIISNSINFKASITSKRDIEAANWLKSICDEISEEKIRDIFVEKSKIEDENLRTEMECELPMFTHDKNVLVGQLEICNIEDFIEEKEELIDTILDQINSEKDVDYLFVNCVDILNGYSLIYCTLDRSKRMVEEVFGFKFNGDIAKTNRLIQRKELTKAIREYEGKLDF